MDVKTGQRIIGGVVIIAVIVVIAAAIFHHYSYQQQPLVVAARLPSVAKANSEQATPVKLTMAPVKPNALVTKSQPTVINNKPANKNQEAVVKRLATSLKQLHGPNIEPAAPVKPKPQVQAMQLKLAEPIKQPVKLELVPSQPKIAKVKTHPVQKPKPKHHIKHHHKSVKKIKKPQKHQLSINPAESREEQLLQIKLDHDLIALEGKTEALQKSSELPKPAKPAKTKTRKLAQSQGAMTAPAPNHIESPVILPQAAKLPELKRHRGQHRVVKPKVKLIPEKSIAHHHPNKKHQKHIAKKITKKPALNAGWMVQLGSFSKQNNAKRLVKRLKKKGYNAYMTSSPTSRRTLYRVMVGPVRQKRQAVNLKKELARHFRLNGFVVLGRKA